MEIDLKIPHVFRENPECSYILGVKFELQLLSHPIRGLIIPCIPILRVPGISGHAYSIRLSLHVNASPRLE